MKKKITIIGGGITGLSTAYIAAKDGWDVTVLEGSAQVGGLMSTFQITTTRLMMRIAGPQGQSMPI